MENTPNSTPMPGLRLEAPVAIGAACSAFTARGTTDARLVEVRVLHELTPALRSRLIRLTFATHPQLLRIVSVHLDGRGPHFLTVHSTSGSWREAAPTSADGLRSALLELAAALSFAHRMGLVHGCLEARHLLRGPSGWWLDITHTDPDLPAGRAPELASGEPPTGAADVWALGTLARAALRDPSADPELSALVQRMVATSPDERPALEEIASLLERTVHAVAPPLPQAPPREIGPYTLLEKLGEGGMGAVYRARARGDEQDVAIKLLLPELMQDRVMVQRFRREARALSQLSSPHVARFVAARRDGLWEYLVMEFVQGRSAHWLLAQRGPFSLEAALSIAADVARALAEVHDLQLVHRDVKPSNILIASDSDAATPSAKLCDFGIVRPKRDDAVALTRTGAPGTPGYMAPEQVLGLEVFPATDVYALGATLFALLTGRPPFYGDPNALMLAQVSEPPPTLESRLPGADPGLAALIARALHKEPHERPRDGRAMLDELETLRRGAAIASSSLPSALSIEGTPSSYEFSWELASRPDELWPHVSNTERLNRAIGLEDVAWTRQGDEAQGLWGSFRAAGMTLRWKENPFEWVAPHRLGVVREYESGPFEWMRSSVELAPQASGGTRLTHKIEMCPRGLLGRAAAGIEIGMRLRRALERTYRRIDETCVQQRAQAAPGRDPFEPAVLPSAAQRRALHASVERVRERGADPAALGAMVEWILSAPPQALARLRPRAFAERYQLDGDVALNALLLAASEGVLAMMWDILCPLCRIPSQLHDTLRALREHGRCDACDLDFELDLARSVELVFRVEPSVRRADLGLYCIGGPAHSPHVLAQVRLPAQRRARIELRLSAGHYVVRGRGIDPGHALRVVDAATPRHVSIALRDADAGERPRVLGSGAITLELVNDLGADVVIRVERSGARTDVVSAAQATSNPLFRELFPSEVLSSDELISMSQVTLVYAEVPDAGVRYLAQRERSVHRDLIGLQREVDVAAQREGGALVKLQNDGVLAVFADPLCATRSALAVLRAMGRSVRLSVHTGTAMLATVNDRLDYFGRTVFLTDELMATAEPGELVVSADVQRIEPRTTELLHGQAKFVGLSNRGVIATRYRLA